MTKKTNAVKEPQSKLTPLGVQLEKSLTGMLRELEKEDDVDGPPDAAGAVTKVKKPRYSLLDKLRVYDRALKLEGIKHKITDDEGSFFTPGGGDGE